MAYPKQNHFSPPQYQQNYPVQYQQTVPVGYPQTAAHHTIIVQNQTRPVYITHGYQKSASQRIAGNIGGAIASGGRVISNSGTTGYSIGVSAAQAAKSGVKVAGEAVKGFNDEMDRTAKSPLLDCFGPGSGIQLISKSGNGCLRCLPDGSIDGKGVIGNDYSCHWLVTNRWENKVILRNGQYANFHLSHINGTAAGTGVGDAASWFKLHETYNHYVRLEHEMSRQHVAVDSQQNISRPDQYENTLFQVHLVYSPYGHVYEPARQRNE